MKKTIITLLATLAMGRALAHPLEAYQPNGLSLSAQEKAEIYQSHAVEKTSGKYSSIDGKGHDPDSMRHYYKNSNALEALALADEGAHDRRMKKYVFFESLGSGLVTGLGTGIVVANNIPNDSYYNNYNVVDQFFAAVGCTLAGTALGAAIGGLEAMAYNVQANHRYDEAGKAYNKSLLQQLNLSIAPLPSGAEAGASLRF